MPHRFLEDGCRYEGPIGSRLFVAIILDKEVHRNPSHEVRG